MTRIGKKLANSQVILKLHGDPTAGPEDMGATIDQILRTFPRHIVHTLERIVSGKPAIFVGYAARDPDLHPLVISIAKRASRVLWVGYGTVSPAVANILRKGGRKCQYYDAGAPTVFQIELGLSVRPPF